MTKIPLSCFQAAVFSALILITLPAVAGDALPSWNDGPAKGSILKFVEESIDADGPNFIPDEERIAVFDNDGTLWSEQPYYFQLQFALDRIKEMAADDPALKENETLKAAAEGDVQGVLEGGEHALMEPSHGHAREHDHG